MSCKFPKKSGLPQPFGSDFRDGGFNFAVYANPADQVLLQIWEGDTVCEEVELYRTGDVWHVWLGERKDLIYTYTVVCEGISSTYLMDPYARKLDVPSQWANFSTYEPRSVAAIMEPAPLFKRPNIPKERLIIYEMHIRGFTKDPSSGVRFPGTYLGMIEKIPHLLKLGVNAVKLLPVFEFNECEVHNVNPETGQQLVNYWGYSPVHYFCPMRRYAVEDPIKEFREMVNALHAAGIEVILDVVYNHTAEGNENGPTYHFKDLSKESYYLLDPNGKFYNFSGCGNSVNGNHPVTYELILDSLRYWTLEMGVDGFRFDLASMLTRGENGAPLVYPPLINAIAQDPLLAHVKLFAEPWDAVGLYQVGQFASWSLRWTEWNGKYRDQVREFIKGNPGLKGDFATRICGSSDIYGDASPLNSLNFITAHDGFTLRDLVSYNHKHNLANGENDTDGSSFNDSWNCGVEGPTADASIHELRARQMKNFMVALFISSGIPMITSGDEYAHTKQGNNNTWCQDNELNWIDWNALNKSTLPDFFSALINIRKHHFQKSTFYTPNDIIWHSKMLHTPDWRTEDSFIAFEIPKQSLYCYFNASGVNVPFDMPSGNWTPLIHTATPDDNSYSCAIFLLA